MPPYGIDSNVTKSLANLLTYCHLYFIIYRLIVVFRKFAYSLMSRVTASPNGIVTAIVNNDAYHQSPQMDKWESMLYV